MRAVVKIGTSNITYSTGRLNIRHMEALCKVLSDIKNSGCELIVVSSGATAMGVGKLKLSEKPKDMPGKQACAAVGQCELMYTYDKMFTEHGHTVAQILITGDDLSDASRYSNFANTVERLLELKALPIINENDTVSTVEYGVGDNDTLGALVAAGVKADLLVLLSDIDGLYTADPRKDPDAKLIPVVEELTDEIMALGGEKGSALGTGGMATKLGAAKICMKNGIDMAIINGANEQSLYDIMEGKVAGTLFVGKKA
jgi:glutamate 5-kinase